MKSRILILFFSLALVCCKKEATNGEKTTTLFEKVNSLLKDSLNPTDAEALVWDKATIGGVRNGSTRYLRIPIKNKKIFVEFVLLEIDRWDFVLGTKIITLKKDEPSGKASSGLFNGIIKISSIKRKQLLASKVKNGFIEEYAEFADHTNGNREMVVPSNPDIITSTDLNSETNYTWMNFSGVTNGTEVGQAVNYFKVADQDSGGGAGSFEVDEPILVDFEPPVEDLKAIEIDKYLKCFDAVPDAGATCTIEILADIPVDSNPNRLFDWGIGSPGHVFLQIKKVNSIQTVVQNIGFYPVSGFKTMLTPAPVKGMFVDNGKHEFNAGLTQKLTPEDFKKTLTHISYLSRFVKYDIDEYNCTDFALDVFNFVRASNTLEIPRYDLPGGMAPQGSNTPQGLFNKLKSMKQSGDQSAHINIPGYKGWVTDSKGPCF